MPEIKFHEDKTHLIDGQYGIRDLVDIEQLRHLFERFTLATGFTIGFLDHPAMNVLISTGWKDICTKFHRGCAASEAVCIQSNHKLFNNLNEPGSVVIELCDNGLVDCALPIIIEGKHIASLATGQMLLSAPDIDRFKQTHNRVRLDILRSTPKINQSNVNQALITNFHDYSKPSRHHFISHHALLHFS